MLITLENLLFYPRKTICISWAFDCIYQADIKEITTNYWSIER